MVIAAGEKGEGDGVSRDPLSAAPSNYGPEPWRLIKNLKIESQTLQGRVLSGSFVLLAGSSLVTLLNFAYNIAVAQFLGPSGFGHATAVYTLLVLISAVTLSFQITSAKLVAQQETPQAKSAAYRSFQRSAWGCGVLAALLLLLFRNGITAYLRLPGPILVDLLAIGAAFYVPLGSRRGYLQGVCNFRGLAINLVLEGFVRLCGSLLLIFLGLGVTGVIAANAAAVAVAYFSAVFSAPMLAPSKLRIRVAFREGLQSIVFFVGQVVINNCDIILVKHFFPSQLAGLYAAVALVGRVIFSLSWAVVNTMFPIVAGARSHERKGHRILGLSLLLVFAIGSILTLALYLSPPSLWAIVFGSRFEMAGTYTLSSLLSLYAASTTIYSLSVVTIAYEMSYKIANTGWTQLAFSGALIVGIYAFHSSLRQVILVQVIMMACLLIVVAVPFLLATLKQSQEITTHSSYTGLTVLRRVPEDEVIAEFLKTDFHHPEFASYRKTLAKLVQTPDFSNALENSTRRALFRLRHGGLWRELPQDTEWSEVTIGDLDLNQVRVFPRAQWRKIASGDFAVPKIVQSIAKTRSRGAVDDKFIAKIADLRNHISLHGPDGAVLLIGLNYSGPFTILDGNHRMVASTLISPQAVSNLRVFCGISPRMMECCWYQTNFSTLLRYGTNLLRHAVRDPAEELDRLLQSS